MSRKTKAALVCGITGQDGAYLAAMLISKGYDVWGTTRSTGDSNLKNLYTLRIREKVGVLSMAPEDYSSVSAVMKQGQADGI